MRRGSIFFALVILVGLAVPACGRSRPIGSADEADAAGPPPVVDAGAAGAPVPPVADAAPEAAAPIDDAAPFTPRPIRALAISTGQNHTCALLEDHTVKCWGSNSSGELGYGDKRSRGADRADMGDALPRVDLGAGRTARAISAGRYITCALLDDASVKCWGVAALLDGRAQYANVGDEPGEMGDALQPVDLGPGRKATHVVAGREVSCVLLDDGTARCWGGSRATATFPGVTGQGPIRSVTQGVATVAILLEDGRTFHTPLQGLVAVPPNDEKVVAIGGSDGGECIVLVSGETVCKVRSGVRVPPAGTLGLKAIGISTFSFTCGILATGDVRCWGYYTGCPGDTGATFWCKDGDVDLGQPATALGTGADHHMCALLEDGSVKCWGNSSEDCETVDGTRVCQAPASLNPNLGASVDVRIENGKRAYGAWRAVDLGTLHLPGL